MPLDWLPRDDGLNDHDLGGDEFLGTEPPCVRFDLLDTLRK